MEPSEQDERQETPNPPAESESPHAGQEVSPAPVEEPGGPSIPGFADSPPEPPEPLEPAEPGVYYYEGEGDLGTHPVLGNLVSGENDFSEETHPEKLLAIAAMVRDGALKKV